MRRFLTIALVLMASPAFAESWADKGCSQAIRKDAGGYVYVPSEGAEVACTVKIDGDPVELSCGSEAAVIRADGTGKVGDVELIAVTETGPICD